MGSGTGGKARLAAAAALALASPLLTGATGRLTSLDERLLAAHNRERSAAGVAPLAWDEELAAEAAAWGASLAASGAFEHAPDTGVEDPQGENLWAGTSGAWSPEEMVGGWIEEKRHFRRGRFPDNSVTGNFEDVGHYTQLMWRATDRVGCALAAGAAEEVLVCRYRTAGNVVGEAPF
ncbi:MAG TPA: CAP domain-containing protein [Allosphingosinicella sp.]|nr:CAP domain-containing protein [Allosphingosinicella sp.]